MVQIIPRTPDIYDTLAGLLGQAGKGFQTGIQSSMNDFFEQKKVARQAQGAQKFFSTLDPDLTIEEKIQSILGSPLSPEMKKIGMNGLLEQEKLSEKRKANNLIFDILGYDPTSETAGNQLEYPSVASPVGKKLESLDDNQLIAMAASENRQLGELAKAEMQRRDRRATLNAKGSQKYIEGLAQRATDARKAIRNRENQLRLIEKGNLDNPIVAQIADFMPKGFGNMLLSSDSQLYRSTLFDEFGIIKNMFPGQIRTKEIELLEDKLADLFKNNEAKKAIIANGMEKAKSEIIRADAAKQILKENPDMNVLELEEAVEERAAPKLQELYDSIIKEYERIADTYSPESHSIKNKTAILMRDPQGNLRRVPREQMKDALKAGYKKEQ
jgi:hypothetical protein